ncbi:MAG: hypothetical protein JW915_18795 [Chitinispirillaceae bacterium]|nr:hypothetical protein [Chitinispirillaceae bacterium]
MSDPQQQNTITTANIKPELLKSEKIIRGEIFCRLRFILKSYKNLSDFDFPTTGACKLVQLLILIIQKIEKRFSLYSLNQIKHIGSLCQTFETFCGFLNESKTPNVPWSIVPALESVFGNIHKKHHFVICPNWEYNYQIINRNIVDHLKTEVVSVPLLIFDDPQTEMEALFKEFPEGIYFIFFPKVERLSALQFVLLGHEIGHIYAKSWADSEFGNFLQKNDMENKLSKLIDDDLKKSPFTQGQTDLFADYFKKQRLSEIVLIYKLILIELVSDIYGSYIFGDTAVISTYLIAQRIEFDSTKGWTQGYLSFRYRLVFIWNALQYVKNTERIDNDFVNSWAQLIDEELKLKCKDHNNDKFLDLLLSSIELCKNDLFQAVANAVGDQIFYKYIDNTLVKQAVGRLMAGIPPNAFSIGNGDGKEEIIDFRNILYGTSFTLFSSIPDDYNEYESNSKKVNLLSIKGIELSTEQERFNNDANKK